MHMDSVVAHFIIVEDSIYKRIAEMDTLKCELMPLGVNTSEQLFSWMESRRIPNSRANMKQLIRLVGIHINDIEDYINVTGLVSLNDVYWVKTESIRSTSANASWKTVNPYRNNISDIVATTAFSGKAVDVNMEGTSYSPEYTTNGCLAKCWGRDASGILKLYKSGSKEHDNIEVYNEYFATQVAEQMGIHHPRYDIGLFKGRIVSICSCFTNESVGFIPLHQLYKYSLNLESILRWMESRADTKEYVQQFCDILFFDSVVLNTDRHAGNIGFLVNNRVNKIMGVSPAFDNGLSFMDRNRRDSVSAYHVTQEKIFDYLKTERRLDMVDKITGIEQHRKFKLAEGLFREKQSVIWNT